MTTDLGQGDASTPYLDVAPAAGDTAVTLQVRPPAGDPYAVTMTAGPLTPIPNTDPVEHTQRWTADTPVTWTVPGRWVLHYDVTGTGEGAEDVEVYVRPPAAPAPLIVTDPATAVGMVRLLATDLNEAAPLFTDGQIDAFLALEGGNTRRAAALACETIAVSEALVSKKISTGDGLQTDGPAVAKELRERAAALRAQAQAADDAVTQQAYALDVVPLHSFEPPPPWAGLYL